MPRKLSVSLLIPALAALVCLPGSAVSAAPRLGSTGAVAAPTLAGPTDVRASYATPVRGSDGRVDVAGTISRLTDMHANTYAFLILGSYDWADLQLFAPAAQAAGINVWVYLVPPTECPGTDNTCDSYLPYKKDYVGWAKGIAALANQYPVVTGWAMDDFNSNTATFTVTYTGQMRTAGQAIHPALQFLPVVYYPALTSTFVNSYASVFDSLIMPFRDGDYRNTLWTGTLRAELDAASALLAGKGRKLVLMVYASTLSNTTVTPDVDYVRQVTSIGMEYSRAGTIAGVIQYALNLTAGRGQNSDVPSAHGGNGSLVFTVQANSATSAGDYAAARATVRFTTGSTTCTMYLWHTDDRTTASPTGYHYKQAIVAGALVWQRDVASEDTAWYTSSPVDISQYMSSGSAALTVRLYEVKGVSNYAVTAHIDDLVLRGCYIDNPNLEATGGWTFTRGGGRVLGGQHIYDPVYSTDVLTAVAAIYAV